MNTHARILNYLIFRHNYKTYLEIGLDNPAATYVDIMAENKESCDPYINVEITPIISKYLTYHMKSDDMFASMEPDKKYDLIFVDGLHDGKQVVRDVINAIKGLKDSLSKPGDTYTIGNITYDDGSEVSNAIKTLVRAAKIERRV